MTSQDHFDAVGAYLLGALSPDETAAFEREARGNADLRADVEHLRVAAEALPASPLQMAPPAALKDRVMAIVDAEAELLRAAGPEADRPARAPRRRRFASLRPGSVSIRPGLAVAASALVLAVGAVIGGATLGDGPEDQVVAAVMGNAKLIERASGHSTLTATKLNAPGAGRVYQVWLQRKGGQPRPTNALFSAGRDGTASVDVPGSLEGVERVLVTNEPEGGSAVPTTQPVIEVHPA